MKTIKTYEGFSEKEINISKDFDKIVDYFLEFAHDGHDLKFETACGHRVYLGYDDYLLKNEKYEDFIRAFPIMGVFFSVIIKIRKFDYDEMLKVIDSAKTSIGRLEDIGYDLKDFKIYSDLKFARLEYNFIKYSSK
jgi:hypothetical protein